ncbi:MAG: branched-chain amino acid transport system ATP-binding protein [Actinomycetota bacterium]|jgi:branched-chain amino acid transport system ATP-binding protein
MLEVDQVDVRFGGLLALHDTTLSATAGRVTGLIGPNGAGKTTLFNVITGLQTPTRGKVAIDGRDVTKLKPHQRSRQRVGRTFQRLEVFGALTARENILVGAEIRNGWDSTSEDPRMVADEILERVGLRDVADRPVDAMPTGMARLVELGRALAIRPKLLLLDEPGSGLDPDETDVLGDLLLDLARDGMAILLVEHDVELVMRICEHLYVLDFGKLIADGTPAQVQADGAVQAAYLGLDVPV